MRLALLADVHSNLQALSGVLGHLGRSPPGTAPDPDDRCSCGRTHVDVDRVHHVGDLVGYGADPRRVVEIVHDLGISGVAGNHDWAALREGPVPFNPAAFAGLQHSRRELDASARKHLQDLPLTREVGSAQRPVRLVHGSPADPLWEYVSPDDAQAVLDAYLAAGEQGVLVLGHTHVPVARHAGPAGRPRAALFNPGSVGQPRDGDPRASFLVLDTETSEAEPHRVYYDIRGAARAIRAAGLPAVLAERLFEGR